MPRPPKRIEPLCGECGHGKSDHAHGHICERIGRDGKPCVCVTQQTETREPKAGRKETGPMADVTPEREMPDQLWIARLDGGDPDTDFTVQPPVRVGTPYIRFDLYALLLERARAVCDAGPEASRAFDEAFRALAALLTAENDEKGKG